MKNHHLDLVRVTEAAAISAAKWVGRGDKEKADLAATEAMRQRLNSMAFRAVIAIGEGVKDNSFGLFVGEEVGNDPASPVYSIAVDPIEGTTPTSKGGYEAMSVIALAGENCFFKTDHFYMEKLAVGIPMASQRGISLHNSVEDNIRQLAGILGKKMELVTICILDRPRHESLVKTIRKLGCRIKFISDCDITACIASCIDDSGIDMYLGIGGAPEAAITAAAMKCMGGSFEARIVENSIPIDNRIYCIEDLARGPVMFSATGITNGSLLQGVQFTRRGPVTHSISMRSESKTIRRLVTEHGN